MAAPPQDLRIFQQIANNAPVIEQRVVLGARLGVGAEGVVYRGTVNGEEQAVKLVTNSAKLKIKVLLQKLKNEFETAQRIGGCGGVMNMRFIAIPRLAYMHASLLDFRNLPYMFYHENGPYVYVGNQLIAGQALNRVIENSKLAGAYIYDVKRTLINLIRALQCMHANDVVHRDFKPLNIMFDNNNVTIIDYGNLCHLDTCEFEGSGFSLAYAPTEQMNAFNASLAPRYSINVMANRQLFKKYDIFSLGCTLYEMLTLRFVFPSMMGSLTWNRNLRSLAFPNIPKASRQYKWINLIHRMILPNPRLRLELNDDLIAYIDALPEPEFALFTAPGVREYAPPNMDPENVNLHGFFPNQNNAVGGTRRRKHRRNRRRTLHRRR